MTHDCIDERLDGLLVCVESEPHCSHHDCQACVHRNSNSIGDHVAVALDKRAMEQSEWNEQRIGPLGSLYEGSLRDRTL